MNRRSLFTLFILLIFTFSACKDIMERDISKDLVKVLAPADSVNSSFLSLTFWWDELKDANGYRLQVVTPSFDRTQLVLLDTFVTGNKFSFSFDPGYYQWRIRAENGSSNTAYVTRGFSIDSNLDLSNQVVLLQSPADNFISAQLYQQFRWNPVAIADAYRLDIVDSTGALVVSRTSILKDTTSYAFTGDGKYVWKVQASGQNGKTTAFSSRTIYIDTTPPGMPLLLTPANDSTVFSPLTFSWQRAAATGVVHTPIRDSLYIYANPQLTILLRSVGLAGTTYTDTLSSGNYYWRVRSVDGAGNMSSFSAPFHFFIP